MGCFWPVTSSSQIIKQNKLSNKIFRKVSKLFQTLWLRPDQSKYAKLCKKDVFDPVSAISVLPDFNLSRCFDPSLWVLLELGASARWRNALIRIHHFFMGYGDAPRHSERMPQNMSHILLTRHMLSSMSHLHIRFAEPVAWGLGSMPESSSRPWNGSTSATKKVLTGYPLWTQPSSSDAMWTFYWSSLCTQVASSFFSPETMKVCLWLSAWALAYMFTLLFMEKRGTSRHTLNKHKFEY